MTLKVRIDNALLAKLTKQAEQAVEQGLLTAEQARAAMAEEFGHSGIKLEGDTRIADRGASPGGRG